MIILEKKGKNMRKIVNTFKFVIYFWIYLFLRSIRFVLVFMILPFLSEKKAEEIYNWFTNTEIMKYFFSNKMQSFVTYHFWDFVLIDDDLLLYFDDNPMGVIYPVVYKLTIVIFLLFSSVYIFGWFITLLVIIGLIDLLINGDNY